MSASKDWNDLDAGGDERKPSKRSARPDLQEKMRRQYQNRNPGSSSSENSSPVPFVGGASGAFRQVHEASSTAETTQQREKQRGRGETPELNDPDAKSKPNNSRNSLGKSRGKGRQWQDQAGGEDHLDKALNSVIDELDRDELTRADKKLPGGSEAVFENNFDDLESPQPLNIPAGRGMFARQGPVNRQGSQKHMKGQNRRVNDDDDEMGKEPERQQANDPMQEMLRLLIGGDQNVNERGDPLAGLLGGQFGVNRNNDGLEGLLDVGRGLNENPLDVLMGKGRGDRNDNDNPLAALLGGVGRDPFADMLGGREAAEAGKKMQNFNNNLRSTFGGDQNIQKGKVVAKDDDGNSTNSEDDSCSDDEGDDEDGRMEEKPLDFGQQKKDPIQAMLEEMTKDMEGNPNPFGASSAGEAKKNMSGAGQNGEGNPYASMPKDGGNPLEPSIGGDGIERGGLESNGNPLSALLGGGGRNSDGVEVGGDPLAALFGGRGRGGVEGGGNPLAAIMGGGGRGRGGIEAGGDPLAALFNGRGRGGFEAGGNPLAALMGGSGRGRGGIEAGGDPLAALMGGGGRGRGGIEAGGNPLAGLMGGGGRGMGGIEAGGNPLAGLMGGGGRGMGGIEAGGNPLAALMGGGGSGVEAGGNSLAALMSAGGAGGDAVGNLQGNIMGEGGNPLAALMGGGHDGGLESGGDLLSALMGGAGRGGGGFDGNLPDRRNESGGQDLGGISGMFGRGMTGGGGDQMSQALAAVMGGAGGGANPMMSLLSSQGRGGGNPDGPQQQLLRQMMGQAGLMGEDELTPENAGDNEVIQQLLAYESMKAKNSRSPRAENAMSTVIVVDTSSSMDGQPLIEAGQFISQFINGLEELQFEYNFQENVALVCVGGETQVVQHFTNDYRLIRQATDSLSASGSSRLHFGLALPSVLLSHGSQDLSSGGICYIGNNHVACPRIIFITDGFPYPTDDIPGQQSERDIKMTLALQNICMEVITTVAEKTLCKVYCVPVGNCHLNFLETLSSTTGGRVIQPTDAKHMSHCILHHNLVAKLLQENGQQEPTRQSVAELLMQVTATAEEDDINGVFEVIKEGEPDVQAREARHTQEMMQMMQGRGRGRGRGRGDMQGMEEVAALMGRGQGQVPGGLQSMMGMSGIGGQGRGIPSFMGRGGSGRGVPMMGADGLGGLGGMQSMLGKVENRGKGGEMGQRMKSPIGMSGVGGRNKSSMEIEGMGGLGINIGPKDGGNQGHGAEAFLGMGRGIRGQGDSTLTGDGQGTGDGLGILYDRRNGGDNLNAMFNIGNGRGQGKPGKNNAGLEPKLRMTGGSGERQTKFGMGSGDNQNEQQNSGLGQMSGAGFQAKLGREIPGQIVTRKGKNEIKIERKLLYFGKEEESEEEQSLFSHLPGGSLQAMLGLRDPTEKVPDEKGDADQPKDKKKSKKHQSRSRKATHTQSEVGLHGKDDNSGQFLDKDVDRGAAAQSDGLGLISEDEPQAMMEMEKEESTPNPLKQRSKSPQMQLREKGAEGNNAEGKAKKKGKGSKKSQKNNSGAARKEAEDMGGLGNANTKRKNVPLRGNHQGSGLFNNVPPMSFGLDEDGNPHYVDLMGGLGGNDKDGEELMEKLSSLLQNSEFGNGGEDNDDERVGDQGDLAGLPPGLHGNFGLGRGQAGGMFGMPGNWGNLPQNVGLGTPDDRTFFQNMSREMMGQNNEGAQDEDGDVIMDGGNGSAPFPGLGGMGGGNLPFMANRGQQGFPMQQGLGQGMNAEPDNMQQFLQMMQNGQGGNQGIPSVDQVLARLGMRGRGGQNPFGGGQGE